MSINNPAFYGNSAKIRKKTPASRCLQVFCPFKNRNYQAIVKSFSRPNGIDSFAPSASRESVQTKE